MTECSFNVSDPCRIYRGLLAERDTLQREIERLRAVVKQQCSSYDALYKCYDRLRADKADLIAALKEILEWDLPDSRCAEIAIAAIAKAEGCE